MMRFILATVNNFSNYPELRYDLVSYLDTEVYNLNLMEINNFLKDIKRNKIGKTWDLPLFDDYDFLNLKNHGYAIVRKINEKVFKQQALIIFDIQHQESGKLISILREEKLDEIL